MKKKKTNVLTKTTAAVIFAAAILTGCGESKQAEEINSYLAQNYTAPEEKGYPAPDELVSALEDAGYTVERCGKVEELDIETDRVKALKDSDYLDICYGVADEQAMQDIMQFYIETYDKCSIMSDEDVVFCYSSEKAAEEAGLLDR